MDAGKRTIVVVDDEAIVCDTLTQARQVAGFLVDQYINHQLISDPTEELDAFSEDDHWMLCSRDGSYTELFLQEEGVKGVQRCFCSSGREMFTLEFPSTPDDWLGNGDQEVWVTFREKSGAVVTKV